MAGEPTSHSITGRFDRYWKELKDEVTPPAGVPVGSTDEGALDDEPVEMVLSEDGARAYRVVRELGRGAQGIVYEVEVHGEQAFDGFDGPVERAVLKASRDHETLAREQAVYSRPQRGLVKLLDVGRTEVFHYLVLEKLHPLPFHRFARGQRRRVRLDPATAIDVFVNLLDALKRLHFRKEVPVVLGDVKPDNLMLRMSNAEGEVDDAEYSRRLADGAYEPVFTDMGCAQHRDVLLQSGGRVAELIGTPLYLPPESVPVVDEGPPRPGVYSDKTDVYALTLTFYELLTGDRPYARRGLYQLQGRDLLFELLAFKRDGVQPWERRRLYDLFDYKGELFEEILRAGLAADPERRASVTALLEAAKRVFQVTERQAASAADYRYDAAGGGALEQQAFERIDPEKNHYLSPPTTRRARPAASGRARGPQPR